MKPPSLVAALIALACFCCKSPAPAGHNSRNSLDWKGTYSGIMPCADCEGIYTSLTLNGDMQYAITTSYLGKGNQVNTDTGKFTWNKEGSIISLNNLENRPTKYKVEENKLVQLDMSGNRITGNLSDRYVLGKIHDDISEKYWKLVELMGREIKANEKWRKEPHMILHRTKQSVSGNGGCNNIMGGYRLLPNNRITFTQMASTRMACQDIMETESSFLKVLQDADSYSSSNDTMSLFRARMASLAKFVAVYLK